MHSQLRYTIGFVLLTVLALFCSGSYHPMYLIVSGRNTINTLSSYILILAIVTYAVSFNIKFLKDTTIKQYLGLYFLIVLEFAIIKLFAESRDNVYTIARTYLLPFIAMSIGYGARLTEFRIKIVVGAFLIGAAFAGLGQILINNGGFELQDQYLVSAKNSVGAIMASSAVIGICWAFFSRTKIFRIIMWGVFVLFAAITITMRARTSMLSIAIAFMYIFYTSGRKVKVNEKTYLVLIAVFILVAFKIAFTGHLITENIDEYIYTAFTNHSNASDITSGRISVYEQAWGQFGKSPFFGRLETQESLDWVHNYLLGMLADYGIVGAFLFYVMYFMILYRVLKFSYKKTNENRFSQIGFYVILIPYVISMGEPTFPFSPGSAVFIAFLLMGWSLKNKDEAQSKF